MGIIARQGSKSAIILLGGMALGYVVNLIVFPFALSPAEIGLVRVLISAATLLATLLPFGTNNSLVKYYSQFNNPVNGHNGLLFLVLITTLFGGLLGIIILFFSQKWLYHIYGDQIAEFSHFTMHLAILMFVISLTNIIQDYAKTLMRIAIPFLLRQIVQRVLIIGLVIYYYLFATDVDVLIIGLDLVYFSILIFQVAYIFKLKFVSLSLKNPFKQKPELKEFYRYSAFVILGSLSTILLDNLDILMLGAIAGLSTSGIYSTSFFIATVVDVPRRAIARISGPVISEAIRTNQHQKVNSLYKKSSINAFLAGSTLFLYIWFNADAIFKLMPNGEDYLAGKYVILIVGLARLVDIVFGVNGEILNFSKYYKINAAFIIGLVVLAFLTNLWLIPLYGISGAAYATAISYVIFNIIKHIFLSIKLNYSPFSVHSVKLIIAFLATLALKPFIPTFENLFVEIFVNSSIVTVVFGSLYLLLKIETEIVAESIKKLKNLLTR